MDNNENNSTKMSRVQRREARMAKGKNARKPVEPEIVDTPVEEIEEVQAEPAKALSRVERRKLAEEERAAAKNRKHRKDKQEPERTQTAAEEPAPAETAPVEAAPAEPSAETLALLAEQARLREEIMRLQAEKEAAAAKQAEVRNVQPEPAVEPVQQAAPIEEEQPAPQQAVFFAPEEPIAREEEPEVPAAAETAAAAAVFAAEREHVKVPAEPANKKIKRESDKNGTIMGMPQEKTHYGPVWGSKGYIARHSAMVKDFVREIRQTLSRFLSILFIVLIGVAFFVGVKATSPNMKHTADLYYDDYNLMDIRVLSTFGLTDEDIDAIRMVEGVEQVQPGYFVDAVALSGTTEVTFRIHSLPPAVENAQDANSLNKVELVKGRYPVAPGECIIENSTLLFDSYDIGDTIYVSSGKSEDITEETLARDSFTIVGIAETPYYMTYQKGSTDVGTGTVDFFMMIPQDDFIYPVYTEAVLTVKGMKELNSFSSQYKQLLERITIELENLGSDRCAIRLDEVKEQALLALEESTREYNEQKKTFDEEIAAAETKLEDAKEELDRGKATLEVERAKAEEEIAKGEQEIIDGEAELAKGKAQYNQAVKTYNESLGKYEGALEMLDGAASSIESQQQQMQQDYKDALDKANDPTLSQEEREEYQNIADTYASLLDASQQLSGTVIDLNNTAQTTVSSTKTALAQSRQQILEAEQQLEEGKKQLEEAKKEAAEKFAQAELEIKQGEIDYEAGKEELEYNKKLGQEQLDAGREQIIRAEAQIEQISSPQWYVMDRSTIYSNALYANTADQIDAIAQIFPVFFYLVAALVCSTTMTRMVDEQRGIIGAYKALGYSNKHITAKYVCYAAAASVVGGALGAVIGFKTFPTVIFESYSMMYTMPALSETPQILLCIFSVLLGVAVTTLTAVQVCGNELKSVPAALMRPKTPKAGKPIFLEKIPAFWSRCSFSMKVTIRNIFRYKKRFFMTVLGIMGCSALLVAGFGINDSISQIVDMQYRQIFAYNVDASFSTFATDEDKEEIYSILDAHENVASYMKASSFNATVVTQEKNISATLLVPTNPEEFGNYVTLRTRGSRTPVELKDEGVVIGEKMAKETGLGIGDMITINNGDGIQKRVEITGITENYVFHYLYMSPEAYADAFRLSAPLNDVMVKLISSSVEAESQLGAMLIDQGSISSATYYSYAADTFNDSVTSLSDIVVVIIICAGLLAFVVLYNLTNINVGERVREIATLKVLGFHDSEVYTYVFRENVILSVIGGLIGLVVGIFLHQFIMVSIEQEDVMFGNYINVLSFVYSFAMTIVFGLLVNTVMRKKLRKIPMVESLKSVE